MFENFDYTCSLYKSFFDDILTSESDFENELYETFIDIFKAMDEDVLSQRQLLKNFFDAYEEVFETASNEKREALIRADSFIGDFFENSNAFKNLRNYIAEKDSNLELVYSTD